MAIHLPTDSVTRDRLGDISVIAELLAPANRRLIPSYAAAERKAAGFLRRNRSVDSIDMICRDIDGYVGVREFRRGRAGISIWCFGGE